VDVRVLGGALLFEPIDGLDRSGLDRLRTELALMIKSAFAGAGIPVVEKAASTVVLDMEHAWARQERDQVALLVELSLKQRATSFEGIASDLAQPISVVVWADRRISLTTTAKANEKVSEQARYEVENLLESILQADSYVGDGLSSRCRRFREQ